MASTDAPDLAILPFLEAANPASSSIYHAIGVEPIVNCRGTFTILGGSVERPECVQAMAAATGFFAQYDELAEAVGRRLAAITGAEWGLVASGCAAAMRHVTTACVTGGNPEKLIRIPDLRGFDKKEVIIPSTSRTAYDHAVRNVGVDVITVDDAAALERAIGPRTAMIYVVTGGRTDPGQPLSLEVIAGLARPHGIPVLADAAAEVLTIPNVHLAQGATVVTYSGGKAICGPQAAGLALGDEALLRAAWQASAPHHGPGRDDKVGKEEIMGMLAAVEAWVWRDHAAEWRAWLETLDTIAAGVAGIASVTTEVHEPTALSNKAPSLTISWDPEVLHLAGEEAAEDLGRQPPRVAVASADDAAGAHIRINPSQMQPGDVDVVVARVGDLLAAPRAPRSRQMAPPAADLSGGWDLEVAYFTSTSRHRWTLFQEGNWVAGRHESEFSAQDVRGTVAGDRLTLRSDARRPGNNVTFTFSGTVVGDTLSGDIHLGEYLTATFTGRRRAPAPRHRVTVPGGPPLAT